MTRVKLKRKDVSRYYSLHTHSKYSAKDALPDVADIVQRAVELGYPALALTDHGNISGSIQLYKECRKAGIKPMPGTELYVVTDRNDKKAKRYHLGLVAYTTAGYRNLVKISSRSHAQFHHKPLLDLADFADLAEKGQTQGLALLTGCYFGLVIQTLITDGYWAAKQITAALAGWFDTYVEIQCHCIGQEPLSETQISRLLFRIARELDLPVVVTQDSHYVGKADKEDHEMLKTLVSWGPDPDEAVFPGCGFHMVDEAWMRVHHDEDIFVAGMDGLADLLDKHDMNIEEMETYSYRVPSKYENPGKELQKRVAKRALELGMEKSARHYDAMWEELEVVEVAHMAGYLLFVAEVCDYMRSVGMFYQIRGSAAGSLLCYLLGITPLDPLAWKLRYDRFLSKDRTKPPDIDIDVDSERREELMNWIDSNYAVVQIATFSTLSLDEGGTGSLAVQFFSSRRKRGVAKPHMDVADRSALTALSQRELISGYGVHAAGLIVCGNEEELAKYVPTMYVASSKTTVSQYDMNDVESIGLVKLDVLGVKTLSAVRRTLEMLGKDSKEGLDWIPLDDKAVYRKISSGDVTGVFQLEGGTSSRGVTRLLPRKIQDVIAAMALFRPGVMTSGATDTYLARRKREEKVPERHKIIANATKETYGILLYQDQVIEILRTLGMDTDDLNIFLKAVKASNKNIHGAAEIMERYSPVVQELCRKAGMDDEDVKWLWEALEAFAGYSFNRAHATVYGITAYRTAWLLHHHPLEYHAAMLTVATDEKEKIYKRAARERGIRILSPDVNSSGVGYAVDIKGRGVVRGLNAIGGVGIKAAQAIAQAQPFTDFEDFVTRVNPSVVTGIKPYQKTGNIDVGVLELLKDAGALESLGVEQ